MGTRYDNLPLAEARRRREADEAAARVLEDPNAPVPPKCEETIMPLTYPCPSGCGCKVANPEYYCAACAGYTKRAGPGEVKGSTLPGEAARAAPPGHCANPNNNPNCKGTVAASNKTGLCISCAMKAVRAKPPATPPVVVEADPGVKTPAPDVRVCTNPTDNPNCKGIVGAYSKTGLCQSCAIKAARAKKRWSGNRSKGRRKAPRRNQSRREPPRAAPPATTPPAPMAPAPAPAPTPPAAPWPATAPAGALVPAADPLATRDVVLAAVERVVHGFPADAELDVRVKITKGHVSLKADLEIP